MCHPRLPHNPCQSILGLVTWTVRSSVLQTHKQETGATGHTNDMKHSADSSQWVMCQPNPGTQHTYHIMSATRAKLPTGLCHPHGECQQLRLAEKGQSHRDEYKSSAVQHWNKLGMRSNPLYLELSANTTPHNPWLNKTAGPIHIWADSSAFGAAHMGWSAQEKHRTSTVQCTAVRQSCAAESSQGLHTNKVGVNSSFTPQFKQCQKLPWQQHQAKEQQPRAQRQCTDLLPSHRFTAPDHRAGQEATRVPYTGIPTQGKQSTAKHKAAGSMTSKSWAVNACSCSGIWSGCTMIYGFCHLGLSNSNGTGIIFNYGGFKSHIQPLQE